VAAPAEQNSRKGLVKLLFSNGQGWLFLTHRTLLLKPLRSLNLLRVWVSTDCLRPASQGLLCRGAKVWDRFKGTWGGWEVLPKRYTGALLCNEAVVRSVAC
jgi:hypothetical protein